MPWKLPKDQFRLPTSCLPATTDPDLLDQLLLNLTSLWWSQRELSFSSSWVMWNAVDDIFVAHQCHLKWMFDPMFLQVRSTWTQHHMTKTWMECVRSVSEACQLHRVKDRTHRSANNEAQMRIHWAVPQKKRDLDHKISLRMEHPTGLVIRQR